MRIGRKIVALGMIVLFLSLTCCQIIEPKSMPALSIVTRPKNIKTDYVIIDEQALALASNPAFVSVYCDNIIAAINEQRVAAGLVPLIKNLDLCAAAAQRAMEQEQCFSHSRPDGSPWWTINSQICYGECLSRGYNPSQVVIAWMNSPTHKAVIMDTSYKTAGIGVYEVNGETYIALEVGY